MSSKEVQKAQGNRLKIARKQAGFNSASAAATKFHWAISTYGAHERGSRTMGLDDADRYARKFRMLGSKATSKWILFGEDTPVVPLVGYVGAGDEMFYFEDGDGSLDVVEAPDNMTADTVALRITGTSLGELMQGWLLFYDRREETVDPTFYNRLCVVCLDDGKVLVKGIKPGHHPGRYDLLSNVGAPLYDRSVKWVAPVKHMRQS